MAGEDFNYKFGQKNNWRRWMWNRISERILVRPSEALVLYLAGADDLDRQVALGHGFKNHNLIAIDRDQNIVKRLRKQKTLSICADFLDAVDAWPPDRPIDVVYGDFCCGLQQINIDEILSAVAKVHLVKSVFAFNFLRGRDASSNERRQLMAKDMERYVPDNLMKHRGIMLYNDAIMFTIGLLDGRYVMSADGNLKNCIQPDMEKRAIVSDVAQNIAKAATNSYKSGSQVFDSVIWLNPLGSVVSLVNGEKCLQSRLAPGIKHAKSIGKESPIRKSAHAILAHRTMLERGYI